MLSRVANRLYWLSRYMERAENTARLINVYSNLLFDLPRGTRLGWETLVEIVGADALFNTLGLKAEERNIIKFLISDLNNPTSILNSLFMARENARTTREVIPTDAWERINHVYHLLNVELEHGLGRRQRYHLLQEIISNCQQLTGLLAGSMSHSAAYTFLRLGRNLERADMSSRIIDMGSAYLLPHLLQDKEESDTVKLYEDILWMNILVSLSGYQTYRQHVRNRVVGEDVVRFIIKDMEFPRSIAHCMQEVQSCLNKLDNSKNVCRKITHVLNKLNKADIKALTDSSLHTFIDSLQIDISKMHKEIERTWFIHK